MAVDFPGSPTSGQVFSVGGASWRYNGYAWARIPDPGEKGQKGQKGEVGEKGQKGQTGDKGEQGNFGGATFDYTFSSATGTPTDLNTGRLRLNNSSVSSATTIFIDDEDDNGTNIEPFLLTIDDSTSTIKGHVRISNKLNADDFALFTISSASDQSGFHQISVGYVSGSASSFTNGEDIIVTFARTGDQGQKGEQGIQGVPGVQDKIFEGNTEAEVVDTGSDGHFKVTTEGTERFKIDNVGLATFTNDVVISNTLFFNKTTGFICKIDHSGADLDLHADSEIRFYESDADKLMFTFDVNSTNNDARLILENDTDTFFNHPDDNQLGFTVGNTETIRITPGKVGLGIINPSSPLHIVDSSDASIRIFDNTGVTGDLSSSGWKFRALAGNASINANGLQISHGTNERINITSTGQVLIGIDNAVDSEVDLQIHSATSGNGPILNLTNDTGDCRIFFGQDDNTSSANAAGQIRYNVQDDILAFYTNLGERLRIASSGQIGLAGANYGSSGQVLTSQGASSSPQWVTPIANTNTTYDLITSSSGGNVQLLLDASTGDDDPILITAGTNVSFSGISATGFTINTVDTNTTYDLGTADGDNTSEEKIQLSGSDSTTDSVILAVSTGLSIQRDSSTNKITLTNTDTGSGSNTFIGLTDTPSSFTAGKTLKVNGAGNAIIFDDDNNTTYLISAVDGDSSDEEKIRLTASNPTSTSDVILEAGTGLSIARSGDKITFTNTAPDTNTTYDLLAVQTGGNDDDPAIRLDPLSGSNDDIQIVGGTNVTVTRNSNNQITISSTDTDTDTNTTYSISCVNGVNSDEERIRLTGTNPSSTDDITLEAGTGLSISRSGDKITFTNIDTGSGTGDTTYSISCVNGVNSDEERIRLTDSDGNTDDVTLEAGTGLSIARSGDKITFTNTDTGSGTGDTTYGISCVNGVNSDEERIRLTDSDGNTDDVTLEAGTGLSISRSGDKITFTNTDTGSGSNDTFVTSASFASITGGARLTLGRNNGESDVTADLTISTLGVENFTDLSDTPSSLSGEGNKVVRVNSAGDALEFVTSSSVGTDTNTTYDLLVPSGTTKIRLDPSDSSGNDDIEIAGGTGITVTRNNANKLTITNSDTGSGANTTYDLSVPSSTTKIRLAGSDGDNDDVEIAGGSNVTVTRNNGNKLTISSTDTNTNTTYTAGSDYGMTLSGTEFRLKSDRRRNSSSTDIRTGNTHDYTFYDASHGIRWYTAGDEEMRLENDGDLHVEGDIIAFSTTVSDIRLKKDLQIIQNPLDIINKINGYTFTYKKDNKKSAGVVAQEVEKVFPQAVSEKGLPFSSEDEENPDNYKTVEYDQIVGLLVQAVKELTDKVKKLEGR